MELLKRSWPALLLLAALGVAWACGLPHALSFESLARSQGALHAWRDAHPCAALLLYLGLFTGGVALSLPISEFLTIAGGMLFGTTLGTACAVPSGALGAILVFLAARHALRPLVAARAGPLMARIGPALERDGFHALLALRLLPIFPFWLVNLAAALAGMRLAPYAAATSIGIVPITVVFASVGAGLSDVLAAGRRPDLSLLLSPPVLLPLAALAVLALLPIAWRRWRARHGAETL